MAIVSSTIAEDAPQKDGRRYITERHTDHLGKVYDVQYTARANDDAQAALTARVAVINARCVAKEIADGIANAVVPPFEYCTVAQFRNAVRQAYQDATKLETCRLAAFVVSLSLSDAQYTNLFGVSGAQLTRLKTKLSNQAARYNQVQSDAGE